MANCFKCGISSEAVTLYDAISKDGLVKVCGNCNIKENLPLIKTVDPSKGERRLTVYERMTKLSGINPTEREVKKQQEEREKQNEEMKQVLDKKFREELYNSNTKKDILGESNLVRNFHWEILKARRDRKMTQGQLADVIGESELSIRMAERGILPRERERLIKKLESYLKIKLTKDLPVNSEQMIEQKTETSQVEIPVEETKKKFSIRNLFGLKKKVKEKASEEEQKEEH
jgi:ribosome-binding protein aMBF1 (putative translation factor)